MDNTELMLEPTMAGFAARLAYHRNSPRAKAAAVRDGILEIELATGATIRFPARKLRLLAPLTDEQLEEVRVVAGGTDLMWRSADVDLGVDWLLQNLTGLQTHQEVARRGGSARTPAKTAASRANGAKGGRPRKQVEPVEQAVEAGDEAA